MQRSETLPLRSAGPTTTHGNPCEGQEGKGAEELTLPAIGTSSQLPSMEVSRTKSCWGCDELHNEQDIYCKSCQASLQLLRLLEDKGTVVYWSIPEQKIRFKKATD
jgi:hypothetical protein